jgi:hypothetical protein
VNSLIDAAAHEWVHGHHILWTSFLSVYLLLLVDCCIVVASISFGHLFSVYENHLVMESIMAAKVDMGDKF